MVKMSERLPAKYKSQRSYKVAENHLHLCLQPGLCIHACCPLPLSTSFFIISFVLPDTSYLCSEVLPTTECGGTSPLEPVTEQSLVLRVVLCYDQPMLGSCLLRQAFHCIKTKKPQAFETVLHSVEEQCIDFASPCILSHRLPG